MDRDGEYFAALGLWLYRQLRHDIINHLQVVAGMIQLGKEEKALEYIWQVSDALNREGQITRIKGEGVALVLLTLLRTLPQKGVSFSWAVDTDLADYQGSFWELGMYLYRLVSFFQEKAVGRGELSLELSEKEKGYLLVLQWQGPAAPELVEVLRAYPPPSLGRFLAVETKGGKIEVSCLLAKG
ncbi:MAG: hypothetical protein PWQ91_1770 [Eubacteriales bacterium]|nr:hypothetical protein [Eubacteriales bacterium]